MNILIVGNGFDLSHYLPTKYDHFMDVMMVIDDLNIGIDHIGSFKSFEELLFRISTIPDVREKYEKSKQYTIGFNDLFNTTRDSNFIEKTKKYYSIDNLQIEFSNILKIKFKLKKNVWYNFFKDHVKNITTWIDFENKIEEVLSSFAQINSYVDDLNNKEKEYIRKQEVINTVGQRNFKVLNTFKFFLESENSYISFNSQFCHGEKLKNGFSSKKFIDNLNLELEEFIEIFNLYLELIVSNLTLNCEIKINSKEWLYPDKIYSFNYTNTYQRIYDTVNVDFLHGSLGENQNIVLGVSDLEDESLRKLKAYGFTKYHQKLFKDTDYLFLDKYKSRIKLYKERVENFESNYSGNDKESHRKVLDNEGMLNLHVLIWGHSLDVSDKEYILDLFSLNDDVDRNVKITIYYFDRPAKFALLNNLLAILEKDKVEQWMKKGWLKFEKNPQIKFGAIISEKTA